MPDSPQRFRGAIYLTIARAIKVILGLIAVPLYFATIGEDSYGIVLFVVAFIAPLSLLDLGIPYAITLRTTEHAHHKREEEIVKVQRTGAALLWPLGMLVIALFFGLGMVYIGIVEDSPVRQFPYAFVLVGATVLFTFVMMPLQSLLIAYERYGHSAVLQSLNSVTVNAFPMALCWATSSPYGHWGGTALAAFVTFVAYAVVLSRLHGYKILLPKLDLGLARDLFKHGFALLSLRIPNAITLSIDRIAIGAVLGVQNIVTFSVPTRVPQTLHELYRATTEPLFPAYTKAHQQSEGDLLAKVHRYGRMLLVGAAAVLLIPCAFAQPILQAWVPGRLPEEGIRIMQIMAWFYLLELHFTALQFATLAKGRANATFAFAMFSVVARLITAPIALKLGGLTALAAINVGITAVQFVPYHFKVLRTVAPDAKVWPMIIDVAKILLLAGAFFGTGVAAAGALPNWSPWLVLLLVPVWAGAFVLVAIRLRLSPMPEELLSVLDRLKKS